MQVAYLSILEHPEEMTKPIQRKSTNNLIAKCIGLWNWFMREYIYRIPLFFFVTADFEFLH